MNVLKSLGILLLALLIPAGAALAADGVLYISPESGSYTVGQLFDEEVLVDTDGAAINAAEAEISFDSSAFAVDHISTDGSILNSWPTPPSFSNGTGSIKFTGWASNNYTGDDGLLITITFKALSNITSSVRLTAGAILAAGGDESNIITSMRSATFVVQSHEIIPPAPAPPPTYAPEYAPASASAAPSASAPAQQRTAITSPDALSGGIEAVEGAPTGPTPSVPVFSDFQNTVNAGDHITVKGSSSPNATVYVWLQQGSDAAVRSTVTTDADGSFIYVSESVAQQGIYHLWAQAEGTDGQQSLPSNTIWITTTSQGLVASAEVAGGIAESIYPYLVMLVSGALGVTYLLHRRRVAKLNYTAGK